jgi:twinkle protein
MKIARDILDRFHIPLRGGGRGSFKTTCPQCSPTRKNKKDRCLSVKIDNDGVVWKCHHCGWQNEAAEGLFGSRLEARGAASNVHRTTPPAPPDDARLRASQPLWRT